MNWCSFDGFYSLPSELPRCQFHRTCHSQASQIAVAASGASISKELKYATWKATAAKHARKNQWKKAVGCYLPCIQLIPLECLSIIIATLVWHKSTCWLWGCAGRSSWKFTILRLKPGFCLVILLLTGCDCLMLEKRVVNFRGRSFLLLTHQWPQTTLANGSNRPSCAPLPPQGNGSHAITHQFLNCSKWIFQIEGMLLEYTSHLHKQTVIYEALVEAPSWTATSRSFLLDCRAVSTWAEILSLGSHCFQAIATRMH